MKIVIINSLIRAISVLLVSLTSVVNIGEVKENKINVNNYAANRSASVVSTVIPASVEYKYNYKIPSGVTNVLKEGQDGIVYSDTTGNVLKTLVPKINKVVEVGTGKYGEYTGIVTGYGPDCKTCDGRGYVACPTKTGKWTNLKTDGVYYTDEKYGKLKILAADFREFPCGTVMEVMNNDLSEPKPHYRRKPNPWRRTNTMRVPSRFWKDWNRSDGVPVCISGTRTFAACITWYGRSSTTRSTRQQTAMPTESTSPFTGTAR